MRRAAVMLLPVIVLCSTLSGGPLAARALDPEAFQFRDTFLTLLDNMLENHWRDDGGAEGGVWLNRVGDPEVNYGKGDGSLFGSELLYKLGHDDGVLDAGLPLPGAELVHRADRSVDHIVHLYRNLFRYLADPVGCARELEEAGTALPGLLQGLAHYSGEQNSAFPFSGSLSFVTSAASHYCRTPDNLLSDSDLGTIGAFGMTSYYDLMLAGLLGQGPGAHRAARLGQAQLRQAAPYRVVESEPGQDLRISYIHPTDTPVIDSWANAMMLQALALAYQATGHRPHLARAQGLAGSLHDRLWDEASGKGYFFDENRHEIHLAGNNCVVTGLLHLYDTAPDHETGAVHLRRAHDAIQGVIATLYDDAQRVCLHDDAGRGDPTYYCTGCNLHLLKNIYDYNRLLREGPRGVRASPFPVCGRVSRPGDSAPGTLLNVLVALLPALGLTGFRLARRRRS